MTRSVPSLALACALVPLAGAGCGILKSSTSQASVESSSKSVSSPLRSSSTAVTDGVRAALERDVDDYGAAYARAGVTSAAFLRGVGTIARRHGVLDWEADAGVVRALGRGLRRAGLGPEDTRSLAHTIAGGDATRRAWLLDGYGSDGSE